ncbi:hypothetical protein EYD45_07495 [Hyunsoonleella flava]|uniref:Uncharacterized protein n=1 Tax=Hyunsoonleella flava TaxID=2527939 RepID=A0A4Q9FHU5_9FLAO|nr:hypothetical protein [Hyunsoonleella flava]TBN04453.1 hypothetical protein EYD45_07495 [Hyunsoonleella flava]
MDKETLDQFSWRIASELWDELYFFIPNNDVFLSVLNDIEYFKTNNIFDTIFVIDQYKGPTLYKADRNKLRVFLKSEKLKRNIYSLLEKQQSLSSNAFKFLLDEYYKQVTFFLYISNWMQQNLKNTIKDKKVPEGIFHYQYNTYKIHMESLVKQFYPKQYDLPKSNLNTIELIDTDFIEIAQDLKKNPKLNFSKDDIPNKISTDEISLKVNQNQTQKEVLQQKDKIDKQPIIEPSDAEKLLLKKVFKLKI